MSGSEDKPLVVAGDIGGTKTKLGLFRRGKRRPLLKALETYPSREAPHLEDLVERFLDKHRASVTSGCFGIAGPVTKGRVKTTNLPWDVSELRMKDRFKWSNVTLINDLTATAQAIPLLSGQEVLALNKARARKGLNLALVAPGTGLGEALLIFRDGEYSPISSEGGHADFAPNSDVEMELWRHLHNRYGHVSIERVLSGPGLVNIYAWLKESGQYREPEWLARKMREMDPAAAISRTALVEKHLLCVESLNMFVSILGSVAGNLALTAMTTGGVYLGGGIPPKILPKLEEPIFMKAFTNKGRFGDLLAKIPVRVILNDEAALLGAARCALDMVA
ncbi:MAG: glucokinase [Deltaproteobacteria bacterium]|nr:glucokinase [Deltaproteobacteria bacterium]